MLFRSRSGFPGPVAVTQLHSINRLRLIRPLLLCSVTLLLGLDRPQSPAGTGTLMPPSHVSLSGSDVALVVNTLDPLSVAIGHYYQRARRIPLNQVLKVHFPVGQSNLNPSRFIEVRRRLLLETPPRVQVYALAWSSPYRVGCQSITAAFSLGLHPELCASGCRPTRLNPYYARGDVKRPWDSLRIRPSMLIASANFDQAKALIDRGVASDKIGRAHV